MTQLSRIEDLYPHTVVLKHKGFVHKAALNCVKWLETQQIMNNEDFILDMSWDDDRIALLFKAKKHKKLFKLNKKEARRGA